MKKILIILAFYSSLSLAASNGSTLKSDSEFKHTAPLGTINYSRDCDGYGKPYGTTSTIVTAGNTVTITETDGVNTWVSTVVTNGGTVTVSCAQKQ